MSCFMLSAAVTLMSIYTLRVAVAAYHTTEPPPYYDPASSSDISWRDTEQFNFALNLEYLEAELFLWSAYGYGLDTIASNLTGGGPAPEGVQKAHLDEFTYDLVAQLGRQEVGHIRAIRETLKEYAIPRPQLDVSDKVWATAFDNAFGKKLNPPFNPYNNSLNYLIAIYAIPYVGLTGYVGANAHLSSAYASRRLLAGLLGVEAGQDAIIRTLLYQRKDQIVSPYKYKVSDFTDKFSALRNNLDKASSIDDLGLTLPTSPATVAGNVLSADERSVSFSRTPEQILRVVYNTGDASKPGGFYPKGASGEIAHSYGGRQ
ncbi:hypothetical protein O6H91_01G035100 [Diphasiastrum complanatum]|uniref:Uncharacterized protein n=1 Tax=Diphasiastrum complanatum TaxID=34168 RepID=A0ACC2EPU0_DIPCM|nr:hypothetical protein O6H91_01G035100 [Diphasiastrum complanatum]